MVCPGFRAVNSLDRWRRCGLPGDAVPTSIPTQGGGIADAQQARVKPCQVKRRCDLGVLGRHGNSWAPMWSHERPEWSWGESNPRPFSGCRLRYDHSRLLLCGLHTAGSVAREGSVGSFSDVNGLSHRQRSFPAVLLCFCCQAAVDRPRVPPRGVAVTSQSDQVIRLRGARVHHCRVCGAPFLESEQLRSRSTGPGLNVETDQPLVNMRFHCTEPLRHRFERATHAQPTRLSQRAFSACSGRDRGGLG